MGGGKSIKKLRKYLVGKYKVSNFALALRERRFPGGHRGRGELKIVKFVSNVLKNNFFIVTLHSFSG